MSKNAETQTQELKAKSTSYYSVPIELVIINDELNGRIEPITDADIDRMVNSILEVGQLQPCVVRKDGDFYNLAFGFTRAKAVKRINERKLTEEPLLLKCISARMTDEEALRRNIAENTHRNATTCIDDAHNQQALRDQGMNNTEIAKFYGISNSKVTEYAKLLDLSEKHQMLVHRGKLAKSAAILLLTSACPPERYDEVLKEAKDGQVYSTNKVRAQLREIESELEEAASVAEVSAKDEALEEAETDDREELKGKPSEMVIDPQVALSKEPPKGMGLKEQIERAKKMGHNREEVLSMFGKSKEVKSICDELGLKEEVKKTARFKRTAKEVREFWEEQSGIVDPKPVGDFAKKMVKFLDGHISDKQMQNAFDKLTEELVAWSDASVQDGEEASDLYEEDQEA